MARVPGKPLGSNVGPHLAGPPAPGDCHRVYRDAAVVVVAFAIARQHARTFHFILRFAILTFFARGKYFPYSLRFND